MHSRVFRYTMFGSLYFTQGTVLGYFASLNALYLLDHGLTMENVGIMSMIALLPFVLKIFMGLLSDKVNLFGWGHRRPYIFIGLGIQTLCLIIVPYVNPGTHFPWFVFVAFMLQAGMALYDTCTDGMAIDTTPPEEESIIQGFMVGGRAIGTILSATLVGILAYQGNWNYVFWLLAILTLLPLPFVIRMSEEKEVGEREFKWAAFAQFKNVSIILLSIIGFLTFFIIAGVNQVMNPFFTEKLDINYQIAGSVASLWGIGVVLGGMLTGWLIKKFGYKRMIYFVILFAAVSIGFMSTVQSAGLMWVIAALFGYAYGSYQTTYYALSMANVDKNVAATMYSILMAISNIGQGVGMAIIGMLVVNQGYVPALLVFAAINFLVIPIAFLFIRKHNQQPGLQPQAV
ncbi:MAG: MFS transporter [Anaerolineaceae bacterium]|nr:MFS transporter [Anaerolineaceae bacterium]